MGRSFTYIFGSSSPYKYSTKSINFESGFSIAGRTSDRTNHIEGDTSNAFIGSVVIVVIWVVGIIQRAGITRD